MIKYIVLSMAIFGAGEEKKSQWNSRSDMLGKEKKLAFNCFVNCVPATMREFGSGSCD